MAAPIIQIAGPAYVANSATNIYTPPTSSQVTLRTYITVIWLTNDDTSTRTVILYKGATGASVGGTEILNVSLAAKTSTPYYYGDGREMTTSDFLVGICDSASKVSISVDGYVQAV